jgi:hypothetical protein
MKPIAKHARPFRGLFVRCIAILLAIGLVGFTAHALRSTSRNLGHDSQSATLERLTQPVGEVTVPVVGARPANESATARHAPGQSEVDPSTSAPLDTGARRPAELRNLPSGEQASLWTAFSEARRAVQKLTDHEAKMEPNHGVRYFASNPSEQISARFLDSETQLQSSRDGSDWQATLRLSKVAGQALASSTMPQATGTKVEYHHPGGVSEWYANRQEGIEHGFTLDRRPAEATVGELRVEMEIEGLEVATAEGDCNDLTFNTPDGGVPVLGYSKLLVTDASGKKLPATMEPTAHGLAIVVDDSSARYPLVIDPLITSLEAKLGPEITGDGAPNDKLGSSVALSGDTALVGAHDDDTAAGTNAGSVYVFTRSGSTWSQQAKITASDGAATDRFGISVALSGDTALIGAYLDDTPNQAGEPAANQGSVYVFRLSDSSAPEIAIEQAGSNFVSGATKSFGSVATGSTSDLVFTVSNPGDSALILSGSPKVAVAGGPDFTVTAQPFSPISGPSGSSAFTLRFTPTGSGLKSATLSIPNNDGDENPFVIHLTGTATTASALLTSTITAAGLTGNDALPTATPFNDGVENLLKYAFNMNLAGPDASTLPPGTGTSGLPSITTPDAAPPGTLRFEFLRRKGSGLIYTPQKSTTLNGPGWSPLSAAPVVASINDQWERVVYTEAPAPVPAPACFGRVSVAIP